jgi:DnaK suppressor protein
MDEQTLRRLKEKLRQKAAALSDQMQRNQAYGREQDVEILDIADQALESYTRDFNFSKNSSDRQMLYQIREALDRMESDSYGICAHCEEDIEPRRLEAVPWSVYCIQCQSLREKGLLKT